MVGVFLFYFFDTRTFTTASLKVLELYIYITAKVGSVRPNRKMANVHSWFGVGVQKWSVLWTEKTCHCTTSAFFFFRLMLLVWEMANECSVTPGLLVRWVAHYWLSIWRSSLSGCCQQCFPSPPRVNDGDYTPVSTECSVHGGWDSLQVGGGAAWFLMTG